MIVDRILVVSHSFSILLRSCSTWDNALVSDTFTLSLSSSLHIGTTFHVRLSFLSHIAQQEQFICINLTFLLCHICLSHSQDEIRNPTMLQCFIDADEKENNFQVTTGASGSSHGLIKFFCPNTLSHVLSTHYANARTKADPVQQQLSPSTSYASFLYMLISPRQFVIHELVRYLNIFIHKTNFSFHPTWRSYDASISRGCKAIGRRHVKGFHAVIA